MSYTTIPTKDAKRIAQHTIDVVKRTREQLYEAEVIRVVNKGKRKFWLFGAKRKLTRGEAVEAILSVSHPLGINLSDWVVFGCKSERVANKILKMCELPCKEVMISAEDAEYLYIPE